MFGITKKENEEALLFMGDFDESAYLDANLDVKTAVEKGQFTTGEEHLQLFGFDEIQKGVRKFHKDFDLFNERKYRELIDREELEKYESTFEHFIKSGYKDIIEGSQVWNGAVLIDDIKEDIIIDERNYCLEVTQFLSKKKVMNSTQWQGILSDIPHVDNSHCYEKAHIEIAVSTKKIKSGIVIGWAIQKEDSIMWFEDIQGKPHFLGDAYRRYRTDVHDAFYEIMTDALADTGFIMAIDNISVDENISIKVLSSEGIHTLHSSTITPLESHPKKLAEWLFTIDSPLSDLSSRFTKADWIVIDSILQERQKLLINMNEEVTFYGKPVVNKKVSIVIPLYGRIDFIEHQMIEFVRDNYIKNECELVYVIDDPHLVEPLKTMCANLYNLYQIPFKTVWGGLNRGYSGANNLGARHSTAPYLIFMNSDLFPKYKGWIEPLIKTLKEKYEIGVIAPRLLFPDGSIQHASIEFKYRSELGVWINHHPCMGLSPVLDPNQSLAYVPAVTGACMVLRRKDFDKVGGWDAGYLIGDFEDTDLCLKLYELGKKSAYLPTVELTHLERQSFGSIGSNDFKTKLVILNATRHQNRWGKLIEELSSQKVKGKNHER